MNQTTFASEPAEITMSQLADLRIRAEKAEAQRDEAVKALFYISKGAHREKPELHSAEECYTYADNVLKQIAGKEELRKLDAALERQEKK